MLLLNKDFLFNCSPCSFAIFILTLYSFFVHTCQANLDFNQCSIFTECCFSFEKAWNNQNHSSSDSHHLVILSPHQFCFHLPPLGGNSRIPYCYLEHPDISILILRTVLYLSAKAHCEYSQKSWYWLQEFNDLKLILITIFAKSSIVGVL